MLKLSFISKNTRETDNTLEKSTKILYDAYIGSPGASLSCLRGYKSNMAPGTVKRAIVLVENLGGHGKVFTLELLLVDETVHMSRI